MFKLTTLAVLCALSASAVSAKTVTLTFDERGTSGGDIITSFSKSGISGTVSATGGSGDAMIFDTRVLTGGDSDLLAPFYKRLNPLRAPTYPKNVLIISEDGDSSDPDDNATGGTITFKFDQLVNFYGFRVFDDVDNFVVRSNNGDESTPITLADDNQWARGFTNFERISSLTFDFGGSSGAIDNLKLELTPAPVPVPASLPLFAAGLGAFGVMRRRKAKTTV